MTEPHTTEINSAARKSLLRTIFVGPNGIRSGWRFLIFVALFVGMQTGLQFILAKNLAFVAMGNQAKAGVITPTFGFVAEFSQTVLAFLAAFIMSRIEKREWSKLITIFRATIRLPDAISLPTARKRKRTAYISCRNFFHEQRPVPKSWGSIGPTRQIAGG